MKIKQLCEMPQIAYFNYNNANTEVKKILHNFKISDFELVDEKLNLYRSSDGHWSEIWFIIFNESKTTIDFIVKFKQDAIKLKKTMPVIVPYFTYKLNDNLHKMVATVYSIASNELKLPILSDIKQTEDMINIWIDFLENKQKFNITFAEIIDTENHTIMTDNDLKNTPYGVYNKFEEGHRYRVLIDFNHTMIESFEDKQKNSKYFK